MKAPILITRPADVADSFADALRLRLGPECQILMSPLLKVEMLDRDLSGLSAKTLIFTSANAVKAYARQEQRRDLRCYAVGPATARVATDAGFDPITGEGTGVLLAERIIADQPPLPCLYLRGEYVSHDIEKTLNAAAIETHSKILYRQTPLPLAPCAVECLGRGGDVIVPLFSPRSAEQVFKVGPFKASLHVVAMSENVAQSVPRARVETLRLAAMPEVSAMIDEIADLYFSANQLERRDPAQ